MLASTQRGSQVLYVAASAREFPQDVQDWLAGPENRAAVSPSIYDALAALTRRPRPVAIIISIESVDWEEMEFFELAARLSRDTSVYVAGREHHRAKIEAAIQRGAKRFDPDELTQDLGRPAPGSQRTTPEDLLAGTLKSFPPAPARELHVTLVPDEPPPEEARGPEVEAPAPEIESPEQPAVRLVSPAEADDESLSSVEDLDQAVPLPWAPSPNRPKRTPPSARGPAGPPPARTPPAEPHPQPAPAPRPASPELTPEELAALLGRPDPPSGSAARAEARGSLGRRGKPPPPDTQEKAL